MKDIQKRIQEKKESGVLKQSDIDYIVDMELLPIPDFLEIPNVYEQHLYPADESGLYEPHHIEPEVEQGTAKKILQKIRQLIFPIIRFMIRPISNDLTNLTVELHNQNKKKLVPMIPIVYQSKEYIMLLHNTINNMIVESSKLKIEEELLKTKIKVLEDKLEFLENRERAIEKKLFNQ